ncbi:MAG: hypothetical protein LKI94_02600 [Sporolactobacillus sp.]|jgi:hypothetical protein|nr:hypothetical protein [Sporolactobacillus sp.]
MHKKYTNIGEHLIEVQTDSATLMNMFADEFHCIKNKPDRPANMTIHIYGGYGNVLEQSHSTISQLDGKYMIRHHDYLVDIDDDYRSARLYVYNRHALKKAFFDLYSMYIIFYGWGMMMEGKLEADKDRTIAVFGDPIGDEKDAEERHVLISIKHGRAMAFPLSLFRTGLSKSEALPLQEIRLVRPSIDNRLVKMGKVGAVIRLIDFVQFWPVKPGQMKTLIGLLKQLVADTPVYQWQTNGEPLTDQMIS